MIDLHDQIVVIYILMQNFVFGKTLFTYRVFDLSANLSVGTQFSFFLFFLALLCVIWNIKYIGKITKFVNKSAFSGYVLSKWLYYLSIVLMPSSNRL